MTFSPMEKYSASLGSSVTSLKYSSAPNLTFILGRLLLSLNSVSIHTPFLTWMVLATAVLTSRRYSSGRINFLSFAYSFFARLWETALWPVIANRSPDPGDFAARFIVIGDPNLPIGSRL